MYKITVGRDDLKLTEMGAPINARMGLNTWAAFAGTSDHAAVAGDVAMVAREVQPVLKALRAAKINIVALHNHMNGETPSIYFTHFWGKGPSGDLAKALRAALDAQEKAPKMEPMPMEHRK